MCVWNIKVNRVGVAYGLWGQKEYDGGFSGSPFLTTSPLLP